MEKEMGTDKEKSVLPSTKGETTVAMMTNLFQKCSDK